ncbi:DUF1542 domain-containing protein, partial [Staphylococcus hominis]|uniref:DUF1542 domain-containing protein n=1 Tax=Staphylococcus hominis TaxID=1290 RepID=UPI0022E9112C
AKSSIDQATNNQGVDDTKGHGIDLINHVQPTVVKKDEAKQAIQTRQMRKNLRRRQKWIKQLQKRNIKLIKRQTIKV